MLPAALPFPVQRFHTAPHRRPLAWRRRLARIAQRVRARGEIAGCRVADGEGGWLITRCAWCGRARSAGGAWIRLPAAALPGRRTMLTHGICDACEARCFGRAA